MRRSVQCEQLLDTGQSRLRLRGNPIKFFVVAHFHYVLVTGALWGIIAAVFYWLPKWTGKMYF